MTSRLVRRRIARDAAGLTLAALALGWSSAGGAPAISADEIVSIASGGVGSRYVWGGGCWDPGNRSWKGADCSGFVAKAWQVPARSPTTECIHPYTSDNFYSDGTHWSTVSRGSMNKADVYARNGHVILFAGGDGWGSAEVYEARGSAYGIVHRTATIGSEYRAIRRDDLVAPPSTPPPAPGGEGLAAELVQGAVEDALAASGGAPSSACPNQRLRLRIVLRNSGQVTWRDANAATAGNAVRLGHVGGAALGALPRISLNQADRTSVAPGEQTVFVVDVVAPVVPGLYESRWQLVSELVAWFGPEVTIAINVTATPPEAGQPCSSDAQSDCAAGSWQCGSAGLVCQAPAGCEAIEGDPAYPHGATAFQPVGGSMIGSCNLGRDAASHAPPWLLVVLLSLHCLVRVGRRSPR